jgi:putative inorganic carbon (hco3(-)) transporter
VGTAPVPLWRGTLACALAIAAGIGAALAPGLLGGRASMVVFGLVALVLVAAVGFLLWRADPAWALTAALVLSPLASNWQNVGIRGAFAPDRLLLIAGIGAILLRAPGTRSLPRKIVVGPVHWILAATIVYAVMSAAVAGTLFERSAFFRLFDVFGVLPFMVFLVAPVAFWRPRSREVLLAGLVGLGAYLGLTAVFESVGPRALVFPRFIVDAGSPLDPRAMGVFLDPVMNGTGMFVCGVAAAIALATWRRPSARLIAGLTLLVCVAGTLFTLERSVWLGVVVSTAVATIAIPRLRRLALPLAVTGALVVGGALLVVPGLAEQADRRANDRATIWDRQNLAVAAGNMIAARPVLGFGWSTFERSSLDYFRQSAGFPLEPNLGFSETTQGSFSIHNVFLNYAATIGLLGTGLWLAGLAFALGGAFRAPRSPSLEPWRLGLVPVTVFYLIVSSFIPPLLFANLVLWFWIGVVWSGYYRGRRPARP